MYLPVLTILNVMFAEPNAFKHALNKSLDPAQLGRDFLFLYDLIRNNPRYSSYFQDSLLVGPDVTGPKGSSMKYLER